MRIIRSVLLLACITLSPLSFAADFESAMADAMALHRGAKNFSGELKSAEAYRKIAAEYPKAWLAPYWQAYIYTQLTNILVGNPETAPEGVTAAQTLSRASDALEESKRRLVEPDALARAELHNLNALIQFFHARTSPDAGSRDRFLAARTKALNASIALAPDNPNAYVMAATELIRLGYNEKDLQKVLAGKSLLIAAKDAYDGTNDEYHLTTYWARDFVNFWTGFAERTIENYSGD